MQIHWTKLKVFPTLGENVFNTLAVAFFATFLVWYVQYHWKRRRLYKMAAQRKGPLALPIIGSAWYFIGAPGDFVNKALKLAGQFESPTPLWIGRHLYYAIWKAEDLKTIMKSSHALDKDRLYKLTEIIFGNGLFTSPASIWKRHRRIIMPTFNQKILDSYVEIFSRNSEILSKQLEKEVGSKDLDVFEVIGRCTFDIFCETVIGLKLDVQTQDCDFFHWVHRGTELLATRVVRNLYLPDFFFRQTSLWAEGKEIVNNFHEFTKTVIKETRLAYENKAKEREEVCTERTSFKRKSFLQHLIEMSEEDTKFTDEELHEEVNTFFAAGSDTSTRVMGFVFLTLGMFPQVQNKVYEEVINALGPNRPVKCEDLSSFEFLERVIKETMRLFPIGPLLLRSATGDIKLETCTVPAGSSVLINTLALHRDPEVWPSPLKFDPDRFLPEEIAKRHPYNYLPFSGGLRNCPGSNFAMMSMKCIIATVIRKHRLCTEYRNIEDVQLQYDIMLKPKYGFKIFVQLR